MTRLVAQIGATLAERGTRTNGAGVELDEETFSALCREFHPLARPEPGQRVTIQTLAGPIEFTKKPEVCAACGQVRR